MNKIWFPEIELTRWLEMHPTFAEDLPLKCICGKMINEAAKPYVTADTVGITSGKCSCGVEDACSVSKPRTGAASNELVSILLQAANSIS